MIPTRPAAIDVDGFVFYVPTFFMFVLMLVTSVLLFIIIFVLVFVIILIVSLPYLVISDLVFHLKTTLRP